MREARRLCRPAVIGRLVLGTRRIALTANIFRLELKNGSLGGPQFSNVRWLAGLLGSTLQDRGVLDIVYPSGDKGLLASLCDDADLQQRYIEDPQSAWVEAMGRVELDGFQRWLDRLTAYDLVVGFELPARMKQHFDRCGTSYVSLYQHPLRFLADQIFGLTTNVFELATALAEDPVELGLPAQIARLRALFGHLDIAHARVAPEHLFVIGQTDKDASLLRRDGFARWSDFGAELSKLAGSKEALYFQRHPYGSTEGFLKGILAAGIEIPVIVNRGNSYAHLFQYDRKLKVATLSSSLGVEAEAAGHDVTFLHGDPRSSFRDAAVDKLGYFAVGHQLLEQPFWDLALGYAARINPASTFALGPDFIRFTMDKWGYGVLQSGSPVEVAHKSLFPGKVAKLPESVLNVFGHHLDSARDSIPQPGIASFPDIRIDCHPSWPSPGSGWRLPLCTPIGSEYLEGFHEIEGTHVWSSARAAVVRPPIPASAAAGGRLRLRASISVLDGILPRSPALSVSIDGKVVAYVMFNPFTGAHAEIDIPVAPATPCCAVKFAFTQLASPSILYQSEDKRELGICLKNFEVYVAEEVRSSSFRDSSAKLIWAGVQ